MLFVQHFRSFDFAFCTSSQDLFFWSKSKVLMQFEGVLIFNSCFFVCLFVWGIFGVCVCIFLNACGYVCTQWRANWKTVLFILLFSQ